MQKVLCAVVALVSGAVLAEPVISSLQVRQRANRTVEVDYALSEDGFVSVDFQTNGVSIGCANFANVTGDCNRVVSAGSCKITWKARQSWPDHKADLSVRLQAVATNATPDYLVVDLATGFRTYHATKEGWSPAFGDDLYKTEKLVLKRVPAAGVEWTMGVGTNQFCYEPLFQAHPVVLTHDYYMGVYEVTQRQWELVTAGNKKGVRVRPSFYSNEVYSATRPVENVSVYDIVTTDWQALHDYPETKLDVTEDGRFLGILRARTGLRFNLPTGAQWEYACRAGTRASAYNGRDIRVEAPETAIYGRCGQAAPTDADGNQTPAEGGTCAVGSFDPNPWGFYDMYGNVREVTLDWYASSGIFNHLDCLAAGVAVDPRGLYWSKAKEAGLTLTSLQTRGGSFNVAADSVNMCSWYFEHMCDISQSIKQAGLRLVIEL